jgi:hypothetical protein
LDPLLVSPEHGEDRAARDEDENFRAGPGAHVDVGITRRDADAFLSRLTCREQRKRELRDSQDEQPEDRLSP